MIVGNTKQTHTPTCQEARKLDIFDTRQLNLPWHCVEQSSNIANTPCLTQTLSYQLAIEFNDKNTEVTSKCAPNQDPDSREPPPAERPSLRRPDQLACCRCRQRSTSRTKLAPSCLSDARHARHDTQRDLATLQHAAARARLRLRR